MNQQEMENRIKQLEAERDALKAKALSRQTISFKVGEKGGLSVYGLGRFPVTLYIGQWQRLIARIPDLLAFAETNKAKLTTKE